MAVTETDPSARSPRAEKTRATIADALLSLLEEGDLQPTATRIAERAGISLRLIYHHFGDLEELFREVTQREGYRIAGEVELVPADLPFAERLDRVVEQRSRVLEIVTPVCRAAVLHEPFSEVLRASRDAGYAMAEYEVTQVFAAELGPLPADERRARLDALALTSGWPAWNALRVSGRSVDQARAALHRSMELVLLSPHR